MNFDCFKDIIELNKAYYTSTNAESIVKTMPDLSMVASRKAAESLAKLVYLIAHKEQIFELTFCDILQDDAVKKYLDRNVLSSFHFIRKNGNVAVHTDENPSENDAISVLENLHFVFGEIAKRMKLISTYPKFNPNILNQNSTENKEDIAKKVGLESPDEMALEMFKSYFISENHVEKLKKDFQDLCYFKLMPGDISLYEYLKFNQKPKQGRTITKIQDHFALIGVEALKNIKSEEPKLDIHYDIKLSITGEKNYTTRDIVEALEGIFYDLPNAESFEIESNYSGPSLDPVFNNEVNEYFKNTVSNLADSEDFTYKYFEFLYNHEEVNYGILIDGQWINLENQHSKDIINKECKTGWWTWNLDLEVTFDFEKYSNIVEKLHKCVKTHIPADDIQYCEQVWENEEVGILLNGNQWTPNKLIEIQTFLDEINLILQPIISECSFEYNCKWYSIEYPFAVAEVKWEKNGFVIKGMEL